MDNDRTKNAPEKEKKYGFQVIQPITGTQVFTQGSASENNNNIENIILNEEGRLKSISESKSSKVIISIWLYASHLRIDNFTDKQTIDDLNNLKVRHIHAIWYRAGIKIKAKGKHYRIIWGEKEGVKFYTKIINFLVFVFKGDQRSKLWVATFKKVKKDLKKRDKLAKNTNYTNKSNTI